MLRILVVDDSAVARLMIGKVVGDLGADCVLVDGRSSALSAIASGNGFDVVMLDRHMPDVDGLTLLQELRLDVRCAEASFIVFSADTSLESVEASLLAGAHEYLMMPFTKQMLKEKLLLCGRRL